MPKRIGDKISYCFQVACVNNWHSWSNEMRFLNLFFQNWPRTLYRRRHADKIFIIGINFIFVDFIDVQTPANYSQA